MKVKTAFFCNFCNISSDNKLNALGIVSNMLVPSFPITVAPLTFVTCLEGKSIEHGVRIVKLDFRNEHGTSLFPPYEFECKMTPFEDTNRKELFFNIVFTLPAVNFPKAGKYVMNVLVDNVLIDAVHLPVHTK